MLYLKNYKRFTSSKKFWEFYASSMNLKKDKSNHKIQKGRKIANDLIGEHANIANELKKFFATFSAWDEVVSIKACSNFVLKNFKMSVQKLVPNLFMVNFPLNLPQLKLWIRCWINRTVQHQLVFQIFQLK